MIETEFWKTIWKLEIDGLFKINKDKIIMIIKKIIIIIIIIIIIKDKINEIK